MPTARHFLLLHGIEHHQPPGHWLGQLAQALRRTGEIVRFPQLASPDEPVLAEWLTTLEAELAQLGDGERIVICHSLGSLLWLHHAALAPPHGQVERVALVAPPNAWVSPAIGAFAPPALTAARVAASARSGVRLVYADDDPYCPEGARAAYGEPLELECDMIAGGGHLSEDDGYGAWPSMLAWCADPAVRITGNRG